ncbi:MAG: MGMT family protein [Halanaeroarchaeum sp.]
MDPAGIYARESATLDRYVQIGVAGAKLLQVTFPETPAAEADDDHPLLDRLEDAIGGEAVTFEDVDVAVTLPSVQRDVLQELRSVPYGESVTVETLARATPTIADPEAGRDAVEGALRANPTPIVVPGHRVSDGPQSAPRAVVSHLRSVEGI